MSRVQWNTILIEDCWVELALHVVNGLRHKVQTKFLVAKEIVQ